MIESFDHETNISNISYYYQYLTNTKYVHGLPMSVSEAVVDEKYLERFRFFVKQILIIQNNNEDIAAEEDPVKVINKTFA